MKKEIGGQRFDDDILRCKEEILRLKNVVPPFGRPPKHTSSSPAAVRQEPEPFIESDPLPVMETALPAIDVPSESIETTAESIGTAIQTMVEETAKTAAEFEPEPVPEPESDESEIPEFNLAEQIMAAQRKAVGNRRKSPGSARFEIKEIEQETPKPTADIQPPVASVQPSPQAAPIRIVAMEAPMSPQQKVIAEIVARDINKFYQARKVSQL